MSRIVAEVAWYNATKRFGFLAIPGQVKQVFVHGNQLRDANIIDVKPGELLLIDIGKKNDRECAVNVERYQKPAVAA